MIGSYPIGSFPYGGVEYAQQLAQTVTLGTAQANAVAFDFTVGVELGQASATGLAYNATLKLSVETLFAEANFSSDCVS